MGDKTTDCAWDCLKLSRSMDSKWAGVISSWHRELGQWHPLAIGVGELSVVPWLPKGNMPFGSSAQESNSCFPWASRSQSPRHSSQSPKSNHQSLITLSVCAIDRAICACPDPGSCGATPMWPVGGAATVSISDVHPWGIEGSISGSHMPNLLLHEYI